METFREAVESRLLQLCNVKPLGEHNAKFIEDYKDGTFGLSYLGFLLYCNGRNPRGFSKKNPNGLLYFDRENLFGIGVFRRQHENSGGHLMLVAPRGAGAVRMIEEFARGAVEAAPQLRNQLLYVRFLKEEQMNELLKRGFHPVQKEPWHPEAFAEDETLNHSVIRLSELHNHGSRRNRDAFSRFENFLKRYGVEWESEGFSSVETAKEIVNDHFGALEVLNKKIGSVAEDYHNLLEGDKKGRFARMMKLCKGGREVASSVFVGEMVSDKRLALYCTISRREPAMYADELRLGGELVGFSALSAYSFLKVFEEVKNEFPEAEEVHLGGSETADLNAFKRRLGARNEPTYWVVKKL